MAMKEKLYQHFCRIFRREIIRDAFRGILDRDPKEEALHSYSENLPRRGIKGLVKDLITSKEAWEKQQGVHSGEIIRALYQGVLGREPAEAALRACEESLPRLGMEGLTKDLVTSEESWERQKIAHAEELIREFYKSIVGRDPDPQGMKSYHSVIGRKGIQGVLEGLIRSTESWHHASVINPQELLRILYRGILLREADEGGLADKAEKIRKQLPWEEIISEMLHSPEFLTKRGCLLKCGTGDPWDSFLEELSDYRGYHIHREDRAPEREEIASFISAGKRVRDLKRERLEEELKNPASMKVLLVGAYGNGNLGDAYQAVAVEQQIRERYQIPEDNIFAASHNNVAAFPFALERIVTRKQLMDPDFVNTFGMIVIGGGGLFSHPHAPFRDKDQWIQSVEIPIIIHAVGASRKTLNECRTLIRKAVAVSGRDEESITAFKEYREDCELEKDPILMTTAPHELERFDGAATAEDSGDEWDCLWILKYPADEKDREALKVIKGMIGEGNKSQQIVAIEPERDRELESLFPGMVNCCTRLSDLNRFIRKSEKVISMRYHGAIFSLLNKKKTLGFSQIKIRSILENHSDYLENLQGSVLNS